SRIQKLVDARLPNLRVWTSKLTLAQQLQHRKVYNELVFHDIPQLSKGGPTTVFTAMAGVVPPPRGDAAKEMAIAARASEGAPPTLAPGGALQFRGLENLQSLSNKYIERLADWAQPRNLHVRVRGQLFVATDRSFIEAVEHAIEKGGQDKF